MGLLWFLFLIIAFFIVHFALLFIVTLVILVPI